MALFELYKPGQGKYVRWGTVIGLGIIIAAGMYWLGKTVFGTYSLPVKAAVVVAFGLAMSVLTLWLVNSHRPAEFMIMTESEMRKVNWPSRKMVLNSTKVVILLTVLFSLMLFVVDEAFRRLFDAMHLYG